MRVAVGYVTLILALALSTPAWAEPLLSEMVQGGAYTFYRDSADAHAYYYAPQAPHLARRADGRDEFTFIKYTRAGTESAPQTRGGLVHFLVSWGPTEAELKQMERRLRSKDGEAKLRGPLPFKDGSFAIVSASAGKDGIFTRKVVGEGKAPVLPGHKAAVSIALTPAGATLLWESFQEETSDVSVVFLLTFSGLTPGYQAKLHVNWDKVYTHHDVAAQVGAQISAVKLEAEVRATFDKLRESGAIVVEVEGESAAMQGVMDVAYRHIMNQMFEPILQGLDRTAPLSPQGGGLPGLSRRRYQTPDEWLAGFRPAVWTGDTLPIWTVQSEADPRPISDTSIFLGEIHEPYIPPGLLVQIQPAARAFFLSAVSAFDSGRYGRAADMFERLYRRSQPPISHYRRGPPQDLLSEVAWNIGTSYQRNGGAALQYFWWHLAAGYAVRDENVEASFEAIRAIREEESSQGVALPPAVERLVREEEDTLSRYCFLLYDAREAYLMENLEGAIERAERALELVDYLSEPHLWLGRAYDRLGNAERAAAHYRLYLDKRRDGEGRGHDGAVASRLVMIEQQAADDRIAQAPEASSGGSDEFAEPPSSGGQPPTGGSGTSGTGGNAETGEGLSAPTSGQTQPTGQRDSNRSSSSQSSSSRSTSRTPPRPGEISDSGGRGSGSGGSGSGSSTGNGSTGRTPPRSGEAGPAGGGGGASPISVRVGYQFRKVRKSGTYDVDLRQRLREDRELSMAGNVAPGGGDLSGYLLEVDLDDPFFRDREIQVVLDGRNSADFKNYVNAVVVQFRREHAEHAPTDGNVTFLAEQFEQDRRPQSWTYPFLGDTSEARLRYAYRVRWDFFGGGKWETSWTSAELDALALTPPAVRREVPVSLDSRDFEENGLRAAVVQFRHPLFGAEPMPRGEVKVDYRRGDTLSPTYEFVGERDAPFEWRVIWIRDDGRQVTGEWTPAEADLVYATYHGD